MRNLLLTAAIVLALAGSSMASEQKKDAQSQSNHTQQVQKSGSGPDGSMDHASPAQGNCTSKAGEPSNPQKDQQQDHPEGDAQASQNQVEYGGGG
ncbi:MAG TPA: hypothetical protein VJX16_28945 [Terriglobales bacterium]|nr:hypothetical protein [Terriglobales bacterium]